MAILMIGESEGLTETVYRSMIDSLRPAMQAAPGLVMHSAHATEGGGLRVMEVWRSKAESDAFFARHVAPNLPPGLRPKRRTLELASLVTPA